MRVLTLPPTPPPLSQQKSGAAPREKGESRGLSSSQPVFQRMRIQTHRSNSKEKVSLGFIPFPFW